MFPDKVDSYVTALGPRAESDYDRIAATTYR